MNFALLVTSRGLSRYQSIHCMPDVEDVFDTPESGQEKNMLASFDRSSPIVLSYHITRSFWIWSKDTHSIEFEMIL